MTTTSPFLNAAYGAYYNRDKPKEDEELTRVGPGTPCGEYLRRFWHPVALSEELKDPPRLLEETWRGVIYTIRSSATKFVIGARSMGGRIASQVVS